MYDLILRNGRIMDGTGSPWYKADVAMAAGRIAAIGRNVRGTGISEIDVGGLVVAPGFIDMHCHSDVTLLVNPRAESAVRQGITTEMVGPCGLSAAPVRPEVLDAFRQDSFVFAYDGYEWTWTDIAGYRKALELAQPAINVATLVGHNALRTYAMGKDARRPTDDEMDVMKAELEKAFDQGARGFSSGLTYVPGQFSDVDELVELCKVAHRHGKAYHTHMRGYSRVPPDSMLGSIGEAIRVGEDSGAQVNISHFNPPRGSGVAGKATDLVDAARERGIEITFDITMWTRGAGPYLQSLPAWALEGGFSCVKERLEHAPTRKEIARQLQEGMPDNQAWSPPEWDDAVVANTGHPENSDWVGRTIQELAEERGLSPAETVLFLLLEDEGQFWIAGTIKLQEDINHVISHPLGVPITDGLALAPYGPLGRPTMPRSYGTFPRVLGRYAREWGVFPMEVAVKKLTSMPAMRMGLTDRGLLRPGLCADITVFNPDTVIDRETFEDSHAFPAGIEYVVVNGQLVVERGKQLDARPGKIL